ncbi:hypothetical protein [Rhodoblastus sp.]|jgi:hypothetical protein|uniref:hypothetical protein n=1 Tax=Rhodoblastus sp. TaxID=1962975 RepID=UPI0025CC5C06|nr:hypothetical protein [Rhodoblastus sp.]
MAIGAIDARLYWQQSIAINQADIAIGDGALRAAPPEPYSEGPRTGGEAWSIAPSNRLSNFTVVWRFVRRFIGRACGKPAAKINRIRDLLTRSESKRKDRHADLPDPETVFGFHKDAIKNGALAK